MMEKPTPETLRELYLEHGRDLPRFEREMKKVIKQGYRSKDLLLIGAANHYLASAHYLYGGERGTVLLYAIKAAAMLEKTDAYKLTVSNFNLLGIAYLSHENYQMALEAYDKASQIVKKHRIAGLNPTIVRNNIADCYHQMGDFKSSIPLFEKCLKTTEQKNPQDHRHIAVFRINLATSCIKTGDCEKAEEILRPIRPWIDTLEDTVWIAVYYICLARVKYLLGSREEGNRCADQALKLICDDVYTYEYSEDVEAITHILIENGDFERAGKFSDILNEYAEQSGNTIDRLVAARVKAAYYRKTGDAMKALETYETLNRLYCLRADEGKEIQLTIHRKISEADREIRALNRKIRASEENAARDPLTGLLNRAALMKTASEFIETAAEKGEKVGGIFLDIDCFKECNDTYGHAKGDEILREVSEICRKEESDSVRFSRYGGDEFFGITHGLKDREVEAIARRISERIRQKDIPHEKNPNGQRVTLSIGLVNTEITDLSNTIIDIANYADKALYHAKESGRNAIFRFDYGNLDENGETDPYVRVFA